MKPYIQTLGSIIEKQTLRGPQSARRLLNAAYSWVRFSSGYSRKPGVRSAYDRMNAAVAGTLVDSFRRPKQAVMVNIFFPCEMIHALGLQPMFPEGLSAYLACTACQHVFSQAAEEAGEVLSTTGDPQRSDFTLDRAYFREMLEAAQSSGSQLLTGYVRATIDSANLRSAVRTLRMKKSGDFLRQVLFEGGAVGTDSILAAALNGNLEAPFRGTELRAAAELGAEAAKGGNLTACEKACDDAVTDYAARAKHVPFGEETVIGYLVAKEIEFTAVRVIMSGKMAGIDGGTIRERRREAYV